jgi:F-type H+-transporting ATPase subunit b
MLIDWFTVGAQMLNFLILVWLLKRFLYKPILNAIDAREKRINIELADASTQKTQAQKQLNEFQDKNKAFDEQRIALLSKATDAAKAEQERLIDEARVEADHRRTEQADALRTEQTSLGMEITHLAQDEVFEIARKTLADLATVSLEERVAEVFARRLREMDQKTKEAMTLAVKSSAEPALVQSAFDLPTAQRAAIQNALNESFSAEVRVRFETVPDVICGIELTSNGQKLSWSIASYLKSLNQRVDALLDAHASPPSEEPDANGQRATGKNGYTENASSVAPGGAK